jgi:hypothetical protein
MLASYYEPKLYTKLHMYMLPAGNECKIALSIKDPTPTLLSVEV